MNEEVLLAILSEEGTNEEKAKKIFAAHKADREPLERAKESILDERKKIEKKLNDTLSKIEVDRDASEARIKELENEVGKAGTEEAKKAFEAQLQREIAKYEAKEKKAMEAQSELEQKHSLLLERRRRDLVGLALENAMTKAGIVDSDSRENARKAFLFDHGASFKPGDDDEIPINGDHNTVSEVFEKLVATTSSYQKFIPVKNNGGGASGGSHNSTPGKNTMSREKFEAMPVPERAKFMREGGRIG